MICGLEEPGVYALTLDDRTFTGWTDWSGLFGKILMPIQLPRVDLIEFADGHPVVRLDRDEPVLAIEKEFRLLR